MFSRYCYIILMLIFVFSLYGCGGEDCPRAYSDPLPVPTVPPSPSPAPPKTGNITGTLKMDNADEDPIEGVIVYLYDSAGNFVSQTITGADGSFEFLEVSVGSYTLTAEKPGYGGDEKIGVVPPDGAVNVELKLSLYFFNKNYGDNKDDYAYSIVPITPEHDAENAGGYYIAGITKSVAIGGNSDFWITKIDRKGELIWQNKYGGNFEENSIYIGLDGQNIIAAGSSQRSDTGKSGFDVVLYEINSDGIAGTVTRYDASEFDRVYGLEILDDGYFIYAQTLSTDGPLAGTTIVSMANPDIWLFKVDKDTHNVTWKQRIGSTASNVSELNDYHSASASGWSGDKRISKHTVRLSDGSIIVAGETNSATGTFAGSTHRGDYDIFVLKLDSDGNILETAMFGGTNKDEQTGICPTSDGGVVIVGQTNSNDHDFTGNHNNAGTLTDVFVLKLDKDLNKEWAYLYGWANGDLMPCVTENSEGGIVLGWRVFSGGAANLYGGNVIGTRTDIYPDTDDIYSQILCGWRLIGGGNAVQMGTTDIAVLELKHNIASGQNRDDTVLRGTVIAGNSDEYICDIIYNKMTLGYAFMSSMASHTQNIQDNSPPNQQYGDCPGNNGYGLRQGPNTVAYYDYWLIRTDDDWNYIND